MRPGALFPKLEVTGLSMVGGCPHDEGGNMFPWVWFLGQGCPICHLALRLKKKFAASSWQSFSLDMGSLFTRVKKLLNCWRKDRSSEFFSRLQSSSVAKNRAKVIQIWISAFLYTHHQCNHAVKSACGRITSGAHVSQHVMEFVYTISPD